MSAFVQAYMIDKRHCAYVLFDNADLKFLGEATWLRDTRAALFQMNAIRALVESKWDLSIARMSRCVVVEYFPEQEQR